MNQALKELALADYENEVTGSQVPVVIDFWAPWCQPCMTLMPIMEAVAGEYGSKTKFLKVNIQEQKDALEKFGVRGVPTMILLKGGKEVARHVGLLSKLRLRSLIDAHTEEQ